jgi:hypothetical protein
LTAKPPAPILDHVFHDSDDDNHEPPPEVQALLSRCDESLIEDLLAIGVHVQDRIVACDEDAVPVRAGLMMQGFVGDIAFSDRVLRPQTDTDVDVLDEIEEATVAAEYAKTRAQLLAQVHREHGDG